MHLHNAAEDAAWICEMTSKYDRILDVVLWT